eukprot:SAG22_NODE_18788_length_281_cov_1.115385_1_plen_57_part_10
MITSRTKAPVNVRNDDVSSQGRPAREAKANGALAEVTGRRGARLLTARDGCQWPPPP